MDSNLIQQPATPTRAKSVETHQSHRDPMDDADSSIRKRPRLDSGDRAYRSMSADPSRSASSDPELLSLSTTPSDGQICPQTVEAPSGLPPLPLTPSKVTINIREPTDNTLPDQHYQQIDPVPFLRTGTGGDEYPIARAEMPNNIDTQSPNVICVNSSASHSPEIEVAEVEDMNDDSGETRWKPLESVASATSIQGARNTQALLLEQFPHSSGHSLKRTMAHIATAFEKHDLEDGALFDDLATWIELYLQSTDPLEAQWQDMIQDQQAFWVDFPALLEAMMHRSVCTLGNLRMADLDEVDLLDIQSPLHNFLIAYTSLVLRMARVDNQMLTKRPEAAITLPRFISERYLVTFCNLLDSTASFWRNLVDVSHYDCKATVTAMANKFMQSPEDGIILMTSTSKEMLDRFPGMPALISKIFSQISVVNQLMQHYYTLERGSSETEKLLKSLLHGLPMQAYEIFLVVDTRFQELISKQSPSLSIDISQGLVTQLSLLLRNAAASDEQLMQKLISERSAFNQRLTTEDSAHLLELAWKLEMLKKCILDGRMEIRVQGVDTMQVELVTVFNEFVRNGPTQKDHPIPQYLCDFMVANRLVEYFLGVDSHPQLISRCGRIIGFLLVTGRYSEAESDLIWRAVTGGQDARFVDAVLTMLPDIFSHASYPIFLYLTTKLAKLPIDVFEGNITRFGRMVLDYLRKTWNTDPNNEYMDMPPFDLCIRLIRQSAVGKTLDSPRKREVPQFAMTELAQLLQLGLRDMDRKTIYHECIQDILDRTEFATGSILAINALLSGNYEKDIFWLTGEWNLASVVIGEFSHMIQNERATASPPWTLQELLESRLNLIQWIILLAPDTITTDVGTHLWDFTVGLKALNQQSRETAWMFLLRILRMVPNRNSFMDQCIREHLPRLQPQLYTIACLHFAQDVSHYQFRSAALRLQDDIKQEITAEDLLWQLSLTAPSGSIETKAIEMLVMLYLDSPENQRRTRTAIEAIHIGVVERCVQQLTSAASRLKSYSDGTSSGEDEPMIVVPFEDEVQKQKASFSRSLKILKDFIRGVRSRPKYSPPLPTQSQLPHPTSRVNGNTISIRYQCFTQSNNTDIRTLEVGDLETFEEFLIRLTSLTGFTKYMLVSGGQRLEFGRILRQTLQDLKLDKRGLLLVRQDPETETVPEIASASGMRPVEAEVLVHFLELYQLLTMEEDLAKEVLDFLLAFPPHNSIVELVCSENTSLEIMFPTASPFKVLYSTYALKQQTAPRSQDAQMNPKLIAHGISSLTAALSTLNLSISPQGAAVEIAVAVSLVDCLLAFLKEPTFNGGVESLFTNPVSMLDRLRIMIQDALLVKGNADADTLVSTCFAVIIKSSVYCGAFWNHFKEARICSTLLKRLMLEEPQWPIRKRVGDSIKAVCMDARLTDNALAQEVIPYFWENIAAVVPYCLQEVENTSQDFFEVAVTVFQSIDQAYRGSLDLAEYIQVWSDLLLSHRHDEFVGRETIDWLVFGLSNLLNLVFQSAKSLGKKLPVPLLLTRLFRAHLFPEIPNLYEQGTIETRIPNLQSNTRQELYSIILALSNDMDDYQELLMLMTDLLPQGEDSFAWSWGFAQLSEEYHYDPNWNFDRSKTIRSPTGYPGLRNLSNTCYMNSLFTQLFMNVKFREFILGTHVADRESQRFLHETQTLFGFMQETMLKSVDSQGIADSLVTYDNTLIDVSIQMDVDEFYNLLFDRWEAQILLDCDKKTFREFYGGQIVQQIKSKECPHISERLEPFSAIQCDIHGKATLLDSLDAYVSGETMEGGQSTQYWKFSIIVLLLKYTEDNKYSCTSCGCYVDAVKRACLKDIPNNLIFHLKRFDYDVMTGMRSKINDNFEFPQQIDMAPFHVDYQSNPNEHPTEDLFELVGVLVHSGTAESGHYYSYVRERPSHADAHNWVEFNDMDVTRFEPGNIPDQCFGGYAAANHYSQRFQKNWNAYMLFYERIESGKSDKCQFPSAFDVPSKCVVPCEIETQVAISNAHWLRNYCIYDTIHADFVRLSLEQLRVVNRGTCSADHTTEKEAIWLSLEYLERVLSRSKDSSQFTKMLASLNTVIDSCASCCRLALDWVKHHDHALRDLLLRCPNPRVRKDFATMVVMALRYLKSYKPQWYSFQESGSGDTKTLANETRLYGVLPHIISRLGELWNVLPSHGRGWDDYFGLLTDLANLGSHEVFVLLDQNFLKGCLEILVLEHARASRIRELPHYAHYHRLLDKGRRFSLTNLVELLDCLLGKIDLKADHIPKAQERRFSPRGMRLTKHEDELMLLGSDMPRSKSLCIFLEKLLSSGCNLPATQRIIRKMVLAEPEFGMLEHIQKTIASGINVEPAHLAAPYLDAAIAFCEATPTELSAKDMIRYIAGEVDSIQEWGGEEHRRFFAQARRLVSLRDGFEPGFFNRTVLRTVPQWAPILLHYPQELVRKSTLDLLKHLVFGHNLSTMDDEEHAELIESVARDLQVACTRRCNGLVRIQKHVTPKSVEQIVQVIRFCLEHYYTPDEDNRIINEAENILAALDILTISDVDETGSDGWNNASDDMSQDSDSEFFNTSP